MAYTGITLLQIEYFNAAARHLNFTEAARSLYVSQPALSKQIAHLEAEIGVQLFIRTKRNVRLTPAGAVLLQELQEVTDRITGALEKARRPDLGAYSSLSIGVLDAMDTGSFLPAILKDFRSANPNVRLSLERQGFRTLRERLVGGELDLVFTLSFEVEHLPGILWDTVNRQLGCLAMAASDPMANQQGLTLKDFRDRDFVIISREESPNGFDGIIQLCRRYGFTPNIVKQLPNIESVLLSVEAGLGVALVDSRIQAHNRDHFRFVAVDDDALSAVMAWRKDNLNPAVSLFNNTVLQGIGEGMLESR